MKKKMTTGAVSMIAGLITAGCAAPNSSPSSSSPSASALKADQQKRIGMPNPASAYCIERGGRLELREGPEGDSGYCHLPDGRVAEEWELFRAEQQDGGS